MDRGSFTRSAQAIAALLEDDLALDRGVVGGDLVRAAVLAMATMDEPARRAALTSVGDGQTGELVAAYDRSLSDGAGLATALLESLGCPEGRLLLASALGLVTHARARAAAPGTGPTPQFDPIPGFRTPPRRVVLSDPAEVPEPPAWVASDEFHEAVEASVSVAERMKLDPLGMRAVCRTVLEGTQTPDSSRMVAPTYLASLRVRLSPPSTSMAAVVRAVLCDRNDWDEAAQLWDTLGVIAYDVAGMLHLDPPPVDKVTEAVATCAGHDAFTVFPGAKPWETRAAEAALDCPLPPHYRTFLEASNGLIRDHGRVTLFGVGPDAPVDVVEFNEGGWLKGLPRDWVASEGIVWVGVTFDHRLFGFDRRVAADPEARPTRLARPDGATADLRRRGDLRRADAFAWHFMRTKPSTDPTWLRVLDTMGPLQPGQGLLMGPDHYLYRQPDLRGARAVPLEDALRYAIELSADGETLPRPPAVHGIRTIPGMRMRRHAQWVTVPDQTA